MSLLRSLNVRNVNLELAVISREPRFKSGTTNILGKPFKYHDGLSFTSTYKEIFQTHIYEFVASENSRTILDCGANMGLSVVYFAQNYPSHQIIAFEPDPEIFAILQENVMTFGFSNVSLYNNAVWNREETLTFFTDKGMGGRVKNSYTSQHPSYIDAIRLRDYINTDIDFLKLDIEGAEDTVIRDCADLLFDVKNIFFEYHNDVSIFQTLHELLQIIKEQGFHYYLKESYTRNRPFIDTELTCEAFDMAINVFCYKSASTVQHRKQLV
ncbi:FkbM family methyltransferase [Daejeonella sp.]|uniref:FkbM family methyltransferase n=1 Tax=Daejeonella sp. TaxID=2805397 RepID=UPI00398327E5